MLPPHLRYGLDNARRSPKDFAIGLSTVILVVSLIGLVQNVLLQAPSLFLKTAQEEIGEVDLLFLPELQGQVLQDGLLNTRLLNYTKFSQRLNGSILYGLASRWILPVNVSTPSSSKLLPVTILVCNTSLEESQGFYANWPHRVLGSGETHISSPFLRALKVTPLTGEKVIISINLNSLLGLNENTLDVLPEFVTITPEFLELIPPPLGTILRQNVTFNQFNLTRDNLIQFLQNTGPINITLTVIDGVDSPSGKYPNALGNVLLLDQKQLQSLIEANQLLAQLNVGIEQNLIGDLSPTISGIFNKREEIYFQNQNERQEKIIEISNRVVEALEFDTTYNIIAPLSEVLTQLNFLKIFLGEVFATVIVVLLILAIFLVASLLISNAQEKSYDYGILRSLGLPKKGLISLLSFEVAIFSIPGVLFGIILCFLLYIPACHLLSVYSTILYLPQLSPDAILFCFLLGVVLPFCGSIFALRRTLSSKIRDALDIYHNTVNDTSVKIQRLADLGVNIWEILCAIVMIGLGIIVYYLIPLSFAFGRLDTFFRLLTIILLVMLFGEIILISSFQQKAEVGFTNLIRLGPDRNITNVVQKNLIGHVKRNRQTAIMFCLCLSVDRLYDKLGSTMFSLQRKSLKQNLEWAFGADLNVVAANIDDPLDKEVVQSFFDEIEPEKNIVESFSFVSFSLSEIFPLQETTLSRIASVTKPVVKVYGIEENFFDVAIQDYTIASERCDCSKGDNIFDDLFEEYAYDSATPKIINSFSNDTEQMKAQNLADFVFSRHIPAIVSESLRDFGNIDAQNLLELELSLKSSSVVLMAQPTSLVRKLPSFLAINRLQTKDTPVIVSMPNFAEMIQLSNTAGPTLNTTIIGAKIPLLKLLVQLKKEATDLEIEALVNRLSNILPSDKYTITNLRAELKRTDLAARMIDIFFIIVSIVGIVLCFFLLYVSATANVRDNTWELAIYRALGLQASTVVRIYIYEALCVVTTCIFFGTAIGIFTSITLTLQSNLFTEMPLQVDFPIALYILAVFFSLTVAVAGSWLPLQKFSARNIATSLREK